MSRSGSGKLDPELEWVEPYLKVQLILAPKWHLEMVDPSCWILFEKGWSELLDPKAKVSYMILSVLFHLVSIKHFVLCISTLLCILINQYWSWLFVRYSVKNPIGRHYVNFFDVKFVKSDRKKLVSSLANSYVNFFDVKCASVNPAVASELYFLNLKVLTWKRPIFRSWQFKNFGTV